MIAGGLRAVIAGGLRAGLMQALFAARLGACAGVLVAVGLGACGPRVGPSGVTADDAIVYIRCNVRDAELYLDGKLVASLDALRGGVAVAPGTHRLELRHEDYFSRYLELSLARAERKQLALELAAILP